MKKELQDKSWACLSKEAREEIRKEYNHTFGWSWDSVKNAFMENLFGLHNLTSDTEPEEMLMVERNKVQELYDGLINEKNAVSISTFYGCTITAKLKMLQELFGDKCMPDKENTPKSGELELGQTEQPSVQSEPKFKKGDKVLDLILADICTIENYNAKTDRYQLRTDAGSMIFRDEKDLEPYTEPEAKDNTDEIDEALYGKDIVSPKDEEDIEEMDAYDQYREAKEKETMEEKELNLCELLKGCEGEEFYSLIDGEVKLKQLTDDVMCQYHKYHRCGYLLGCSLDGACLLYPSRALYEKYPLDAKAAWDEWAESRKPKRWRAEKGEEYVYIDTDCILWSAREENSFMDDKRHKCGNYFRTEEEAQQAAEGIREYLKSFHEKH